MVTLNRYAVEPLGSCSLGFDVRLRSIFLVGAFLSIWSVGYAYRLYTRAHELTKLFSPLTFEIYDAILSSDWVYILVCVLSNHTYSSVDSCLRSF